MLSAIVLLLVFGIIAWFVNQTPIPRLFKVGIFALLAIAAILVIAGVFGIHVGGVSLR